LPIKKRSWKRTFTYYRYGNRRFDTANTTTIPNGCAVAVCNPTIDPATNKLIGYQFDSSGNTKTDANGQTFVYDAENKQVEVKNSSNQTVGQYFYDGDGKRIKKVVPATQETTLFVYDASGKMVAEYSTVLSQTPQVSYLTSDHLGSPRINTDANGQVIARHDYQPFGEEIQRASYGADSTRQKFTGYERDTESKLDFAQARMFGSGVGRFTSPDPLTRSMKVWSPQSFNRYSYVGNNPTNFVDPSGLCKVNGGADDGKPCPDVSGTIYTNPNGGFANYACTGCTAYTGGTVFAVIGGMSVKITSGGWTNLGPAVAETTVEAGYGVLEDSLITVGESAISTTISLRPLLSAALGAPGIILGAAQTIEPNECPSDVCEAGTGPPIHDPQLDIQPDTGPSPATTTEENSPNGPFFQRNGAIRQSLSQLTAQAEAAERAGFGYGISVNLVPQPTNSNSRVATTQEANAAFQINPTPTRNYPNHHTLIFPKPLTQNTVDRFYNIFRRR
jgi:RHS repeat-associated protein